MNSNKGVGVGYKVAEKTCKYKVKMVLLGHAVYGHARFEKCQERSLKQFRKNLRKTEEVLFEKKCRNCTK